MPQRTLLLVGTRKGTFIFESDASRRTWSLKGPFCAAWPIHHVVGDPESGTIYAGGGNEWFGPAVWKSTDRGATWSHSSAGLAYAEGEQPIKAVWSLARGRGGRLYAGVEPAGLFESTDEGESWSPVNGLHNHPTRKEWQPGGGGLILHTILPHPSDTSQIWVAVSTGGVYYSADGGASWAPRNKGTRSDFLPEDQRYPEFGQCVHNIAVAAGMPNRLYQQNHCGMYRSDDSGLSWQSIEAGLPSTFGFPVATHPRDPDTAYLAPLNGDAIGRFMPDGAAAVWRTRDAGHTWQALRAGLPQQDAYFGILRQAMATDAHDPAGIYFGTSGGQLYASNDEGESWSAVAHHLPVITSVETLTLDD